MKRLLFFVTLTALLVTPFAARSQMTMSPAMVGGGPHGYDWLIGTWSCVNRNPSAIAGPSTSSFTATRVSASALFIRTTGKNFDSGSYLTYAPKTKTWWAPDAYADGSYEIESSTDTGGRKATFAGTYYNVSGPAMKVRDLYTLLSRTKQNDIGQLQTGGVWKTLYNVTCTKS